MGADCRGPRADSCEAACWALTRATEWETLLALSAHNRGEEGGSVVLVDMSGKFTLRPKGRPTADPGIEGGRETHFLLLWVEGRRFEGVRNLFFPGS